MKKPLLTRGFRASVEAFLVLASGFRLLTALDAGAFVVFSFTNLGNHARLGAAPFKTFERAVNGLAVFYMNLRHLYPSLRSARRPDARGHRQSLLSMIRNPHWGWIRILSTALSMANKVIIRNLAVLVKDFLRLERNFSLWNESAGCRGLSVHRDSWKRLTIPAADSFPGMLRESAGYRISAQIFPERHAERGGGVGRQQERLQVRGSADIGLQIRRRAAVDYTYGSGEHLPGVGVRAHGHGHGLSDRVGELHPDGSPVRQNIADGHAVPLRDGHGVGVKL